MPEPTPGPPLPFGSDSLLKAIQDRNVESVQTLVDAGFAVNVQDENGDPFLDVAINRGRVAFFSSDIADSEEIVQILVDAGADASARDAGGNPLLHEVIWRVIRKSCRFSWTQVRT